MVEFTNECLNGLNHFGNTFCRYAVGAFLQSALLIIVLFGMDLLLRKHVRAVVRYCIWLLVLVKLILPPTLSLPTGIGYWAPDRVSTSALLLEHPVPTIDFDQVTRKTHPPTQTPEVLIPVEPAAVNPAESDSASPPVPASLTPITWQAILMLFWLVGMLAFVALLAQRIRFVRGLVATSTAVQGPLLVLLEDCCEQMHFRGRVRLRTSEALPSPAVCGLLRPTILMPAPLVAKLSPEGLKAALIHELAHIKRADLWANALQTFLQVVYFYNPFVWFANAIISRTCEEAVDETVLVMLGGQAGDYSDTLLKISETAFWKADFGLRLIGVAESKKALKRRIRYMWTRPIPQSTKVGTLGTIIILLLAAVLLPMARGERSSQETSTPSPIAAVTDESQKDSHIEVNDVIVDPDTGVKFVLAKTISGANNVIAHVNKLIMSPDARSLIFWGRVIPLDGSETFSYTVPERWGEVRDVTVSPNGRYIVHGQNTVWLQPVSAETLRPDGPGKRLLDLKGERLADNWYKPLRWTQDSQIVFFKTNDMEGRSHRYAFSAATGAPVSFPDAAYRGLPSPDGKSIALTDTGGFWVKPTGDGGARVLCQKGTPPAAECWSRDGKWLIGFQAAAPLVDARFVSYPEGQEYLISMPKELAKDNNTNCVGVSSDRRTLYFYHAGYKLTWGVWIASVEGKKLTDIETRRDYQWAADGKAVFHTRYRYTTQWESHLLLSPLSGDEPIQFSINPAISGPWYVSPDSRWLLFTEAQESDSSVVDLSIRPLFMAAHEVREPAKVLFHIAGQSQGSSIADSTWSPDNKRVAFTCKADPVNDQDIWIVYTDDRKPIRLTNTTAIERDLKWSPDGKTLAFVSNDDGDEALKVIQTTGGEAVVLRRWAETKAPLWGWSPDSKSLTIAEEDTLMRQPLSGGKSEPILKLHEYEIEKLEWHGWSPDGKRLALAHYTRSNKGLLSPYGQIVFFRVAGDRLQRTGTTDLGAATSAQRYTWSPDSKHVACEREGLVATMPEGRLYAVAVNDIVERIEAGAIPPVGPMLGEPATGEIQPEPKPTANLEPIADSVFSDNFDNGLSGHWQIVSANSDSAYTVENGRLMLENSSICLNQIDWTDYRVTVRFCMKKTATSDRITVAIDARKTASDFGVDKMDRYAFLYRYNETSRPSAWWLAYYYHVASGASRGATLGRKPYSLNQETWYKLAFEIRDEHLRAYLNDELVIEATDARLSKGAVRLTAAGAPVLFDDFSLQRLP